MLNKVERDMHMDQISVMPPSRIEERQVFHVSAVQMGVDALSREITYEPSLAYFLIKRILDVVLSACGIVVLIPIFLVVAVCIYLDDKGPVLHFREIIGLHGRRFYALKFRTMIQDADGYLVTHPELMRRYQQNMKLVNDPRITKVGRFLRKTSLDELPQLFNVLVGQMSLVGPRIIHPSELPR